MSNSEAPVVFDVVGHAGHIVLNRPKAINALTHEMVGLIDAQLTAWESDDTVTTVVLRGAGERGLCAGGDIVALWKDAKAGGTEAAAFWADEYRLNARIASYPKPFVAIMDGIVLGGGIGLSAHAAIRVVTEKSSIGMPETGIGFLPDVGGTYLLSHAPGETGTHLALTAGSVKAGDGIYIGMADHYVTTDKLDALYEALASGPAEETVASFAEAAPASGLAEARSWIDDAYSSNDAEEIVAQLRAAEGEAANKAADTIEKKSPTSVKVTLRALRDAATYDLHQALTIEYRIAVHMHARHDFAEGIRAQVIDKDRNPQWSPASLDGVTDDIVEAHFESLGSAELDGLGHN